MFWNGSILFCYYTLLLSVVLGNILTEDAFIYLFLLCLFLLTFSPPELCNMFVLKNESYKNRAKSTKSILLPLLLTFTSGLLNIFVLRNESHTNRVKSTKSVSILLPFYSHLLLLDSLICLTREMNHTKTAWSPRSLCPYSYPFTNIYFSWTP